jgi:hypothetical protein
MKIWSVNTFRGEENTGCGPLLTKYLFHNETLPLKGRNAFHNFKADGKQSHSKRFTAATKNPSGSSE